MHLRAACSKFSSIEFYTVVRVLLSRSSTVAASTDGIRKGPGLGLGLGSVRVLLF